MVYQKSCSNDYSSCEFITFLFDHQFECWENPKGCLTCEDDITTQISCVDLAKLEEEALIKAPACTPVWFDQVNDLFCWKNNCDDYRFVKCGEDISEMEKRDRDQLLIDERIETIEERATEEPGDMMDEGVSAIAAGTDNEQRPGTTDAESIEVTPQESARSRAIITVEKRNFINARFTSYKNYAEKLISETNDNKLAVRTRRFVGAANPEAEVYNKLMAALVEAWKEKGTLSRKQALGLIETATFFVLDKNSFNGKKVKQLLTFKTGFDALKQGGLKTEKIYLNWSPEEVKKYEPKTDLEAIRKLLTG